VAITIRALADADIDGVVEFSPRAWAPVFASFRRVLGETIYPRVCPDWPASQARDVAGICRGNSDTTWVAEVDGRPVGFVVVILDREARGAEIEMLAVDPEHQRKGLATALMEFAFDRMREAGREWWRSERAATPATRRLAAPTRASASPPCLWCVTTRRSTLDLAR
jgi:GNAT superfamily N-acetyltransferase